MAAAAASDDGFPHAEKIQKYPMKDNLPQHFDSTLAVADVDQRRKDWQWVCRTNTPTMWEIRNELFQFQRAEDGLG